ncbi:DUF2934 domain-containing protein [Chlorobium ferrooxidans]|uniref:DUF2934 domain-containing protein n=1 Tax=Chlorobium ferrooxidans TaxID=84205 RepID=UPI000A01C248|nr:DUF2934 domain-containing protein [Chlorobium ferrooxidans]
MSNEANEREVSALEQREDEIRLSAYYIWELKGGAQGSDVEDWIEAEQALND